jgi:Putative metallopeptidase
MKRPMSAAAIAWGLLCCGAPSALAQLQPAPPSQANPQVVGNPQVEIKYLEPQAANLKPIAERLRARKVLEEFAQFTVALKLPKKLTMQFDQCGATVRYHVPGEPATVCYELVDQIEKIGAKADPDTREMVLAGAIVQAIFHEGANAIFDVLSVPVWGRREDAADRLAGFLMVEMGSDVAYQLIVGTAVFFQTSGKSWTGSQFADINAPEAQRFFNYLCMALGSDQVRFGYLAEPEDKNTAPIIPKERAARCAGEFTQVRSAFNLRIMPFVDPDLLVKLRAAQWTLSSTGR